MKKRRKTNLLRETSRSLPPRADIEWFRDRVLEWAAANGRDFPWRHTTDEYRIVVTEILLQQTTATAVERLYSSFFDRFPNWQSLYAASEGEVEDALRPLGLYRQRSKRLKALAAWVAEHGWQLPSTRDELEDVPGIGQYVASVLLAVKYGEPEPMLDVNMARVLERFFGERELADLRDDPWLQLLARQSAAGACPGWAVLDFAATVCRKRVRLCSACVLVHRCRAGGEANGN